MLKADRVFVSYGLELIIRPAVGGVEVVSGNSIPLVEAVCLVDGLDSAVCEQDGGGCGGVVGEDIEELASVVG